MVRGQGTAIIKRVKTENRDSSCNIEKSRGVTVIIGRGDKRIGQ